jgi:hypothetical protein
MTFPENTPPGLTEQLAAELRSQAAEFGLVLAGRCQWCGRPVWDHKSLSERAGPVCRRRNKTRDTKEDA